MREEVKSGTRADNRPVLREVMAALRRGEADVVVVSKLDRLSRSVVDAGRLLEEARKRGFNIVALDLGLDLSIADGRAGRERARRCRSVGTTDDRRPDE